MHLKLTLHCKSTLVISVLLPSCVQLSATPWTIAHQASLSLTISQSWPKYTLSSLQFSHSVVSDSATPWISARQASLSITNCQSSLKLMSIESVMPSSHLILCRPLLLLPPIPPSIRVFSKESTLLMRWPKYWSFSFSISPSKKIPGLISFRMDWLDLLAVQGTLKSLLQHRSSKASILWHSAFFTVQLSHPYMTTGKTIALTRRTFVANTYIKHAIILKQLESKTDFRSDEFGFKAKHGCLLVIFPQDGNFLNLIFLTEKWICVLVHWLLCGAMHQALC